MLAAAGLAGLVNSRLRAAYAQPACERPLPFWWALEDLVKYNPKCKLCSLHKGAKTVCMPGDGAFVPGMVVGEAPGRSEDNQGKPFVGDAGRLLDAALAISFVDGTAREHVFVTNVVKCRPPQNAKPTDAQMKACFEYLYWEIKKCDPVGILALGNSAIEVLLGKTGITRHRGKWHRLERKRETWVMPSWHPAYVLRKGGFGTEEYAQFVSDVDAFAGKVLSWEAIGHPADNKLRMG